MQPAEHSLPWMPLKEPPCANDAHIINNVVLPEKVITALNMRGISLSWYTTGELLEAVDGCSIDSQLEDDEDGISFSDKIRLTAQERDENEKNPYRMSMRVRPPAQDNSPSGGYFTERLASERQKKPAVGANYARESAETAHWLCA